MIMPPDAAGGPTLPEWHAVACLLKPPSLPDVPWQIAEHRAAAVLATQRAECIRSNIGRHADNAEAVADDITRAEALERRAAEHTAAADALEAELTATTTTESEETTS